MSTNDQNGNDNFNQQLTFAILGPFLLDGEVPKRYGIRTLWAGRTIALCAVVGGLIALALVTEQLFKAVQIAARAPGANCLTATYLVAYALFSFIMLLIIRDYARAHSVFASRIEKIKDDAALKKASQQSEHPESNDTKK